MYRRDIRKDFCEFKVLKSLVWLAKEVDYFRTGGQDRERRIREREIMFFAEKMECSCIFYLPVKY